MTFINIVSEIFNIKIGSIEERPCPDQYVGKILEFNPCEKDFPIRLPAQDRPHDTPCIILILESPHKKEFIGKPAPAKGSTGLLIRKWIGELEGLSLYKGYGLILVNAIRYQCSLGMSTKCFRDEIFRRAWSEGHDKEFLARLEEYYQDRDIVVNCCTKGNDKKNELSRMVQKTIDKANVKCDPLGRNHPCSWFDEKKRNSTWLL